jgi:hypothetical protein
MGSTAGTSTTKTKPPILPIALSDIRTGLDAVCLIDVVAFLLQCAVNKNTKQDIARFVCRNQSAFPQTSGSLLDSETFEFEPKAGHQQKRKAQAIRTPERLVGVITEYLQYHQKKRKYDTVKAQSRELAAELIHHYLPKLWPDSAVNVRESFAPFFECASDLPGNEDVRPAPTPSRPIAGPPPQVNLCFKSSEIRVA